MNAPTPRTTPGTETTVLRIGVLALGGLGGSGRVACDVARGLGEGGHTVVMLTCSDPQFLLEHGDNVVHRVVGAPREPRIPGPWIEDLTRDLVEAVVAHDLRVLWVHYGAGLAEAAVNARDQLADRGLAVRVVVTLHGSDVSGLGPTSADADRLARAVRRADAVTAVSEHLSLLAQRVLALRTAPAVIENGVDADIFRPAETPTLAPALVHVSNFRPVKRPLDNLDVLDRLRLALPAVHLTMIGDGPLRERTRRAAADRGLSDRVTFVDPVDQAGLAARLRRCRFLVVTSEHESFGLVALEAMASGLLVVGTRCGGLEEILAREARFSGLPSLLTELLVEPGDTAALAARIEHLATDAPGPADIRRRLLAVGRHAFGRTRQLGRYARLLTRIQTGDRA